MRGCVVECQQKVETNINGVKMNMENWSESNKRTWVRENGERQPCSCGRIGAAYNEIHIQNAQLIKNGNKELWQPSEQRLYLG